MKENKYDDARFFAQYSGMDRSKEGLAAAGEWYALRELLPDFTGARVLDMGCGFGWHCQYAAKMGAASVVGTDISERMLKEAQKRNEYPHIVTYSRVAIEDIDYADASFDVVISSLALHYVASFEAVAAGVFRMLRHGGWFVFSVEHPVFTAAGKQDWHYNQDGEKLHWPVDRYYEEGRRDAVFLGESVIKYHKTVMTYANTLADTGFSIKRIVEPRPDPALLRVYPEHADELRRPMFLLMSARK